MVTKRLFAVGLFGLGSALLLGCPIYPEDRDHRVCVSGDCYRCPDSFYSPSCGTWHCDGSEDCPSGYTCNSSNVCKFTDGTPNTTPPSGACAKPSDCASGLTCGQDNKCHTGDCSQSGCPSGLVCALPSGSNGVPSCVAVIGTPDGGGGSTSACKNDNDCANAPNPAGSRCLTGKCVAPADQCADATQCAGGSQCVQGACTPACGPAKTCPTGYACDTTKNVCTGQTTTCTSSSQCTGGNVCVQEHCVAPCGAGGTCDAGLKCVDGGCTPDQQPLFTCSADGAQGECQSGSICLRHSCYIGCDSDAGADACKAADQFNVCKSVTTASGAHSVCGSTNNLGSECDPTQNKGCPSQLVCIDGFCK